MVLTLTAQERRELFAELCEQFRQGECTTAEFRQACKEAGIETDDVNLKVGQYQAENIRNWRAR